MVYDILLRHGITLFKVFDWTQDVENMDEGLYGIYKYRMKVNSIF
jgi:pyruvate/oxaloacetate carboxyltransferase